MDPQRVFCPNLACPARGRVGAGNIGVHVHKTRRFICHLCKQTFSATKGTPFYRLKVPADDFIKVVTLLAHGCPLQAIVVAFNLDERTVSSWLARAGQQAQAVQHHLVEHPHDLGQVQMDEIRVKQQGQIVWMGLAIAVTTRLWLGGVVSAHRDQPMITALVQKVRACASALSAGLLFCTDGLRAYVTAIRVVFRERVVSHRRGRPQLQSWPKLHFAQSIKQYAGKVVTGIHRRVVQGSLEQIAALIQQTQGKGSINTAYIERLNGTFRERLSSLARKTRALSRRVETLHWGMYLVGAVYNFCTEHESLRQRGLIGGHKWLYKTPVMAAAISDHRWSIKELLTYHVPPEKWSPPKRRGRVSEVTKRLIARWYQ